MDPDPNFFHKNTFQISEIAFFLIQRTSMPVMGELYIFKSNKRNNG